MSDSLFDVFEKTGAAEWREAAQRALKGSSPEEVLGASTWEGIAILPIYHREDRERFAPGAGKSAAVEAPEASRWEIVSELALPEPSEFNGELVRSLDRGLEVPEVVLGGGGGAGLRVESLDDLRRAFQGVAGKARGYRFSGNTGPAFLAVFAAWMEREEIDRANVRGSLGLDPLGRLASTGRLRGSVAEAFDELAACVAHCSKRFPGFRAASVSSLPYHNAGAGSVDELGFALASGLQVIRELCKRGVGVDDAFAQLSFGLGVGPDFFMEIAKFRAARVLWRKIAVELGADEQGAGMNLHARTGCYNKTKRQAHVNLVRTTTEALSALIGGVDSLCVGPFDEVVGAPGKFSRRLATSLPMVLRHECGLDVPDPARGSYFIESLTEQVASGAWEVFREIESVGGFLDALLSGRVEERVRQIDALRRESLEKRQYCLVGVNRYCHEDHGGGKGGEALGPNSESEMTGNVQRGVSDSGERMSPGSEAIEERIAASVEAARNGTPVRELDARIFDGVPGGACPKLAPLRTNFWAEAYENLDVAVDAYERRTGNRPRMLLLGMGRPREHFRQLGFARDFFAAGGFRIEEQPLEGSPDDLAANIEHRVPQVVVICGVPEICADRAPSVAKVLKNLDSAPIVLVATSREVHEELAAKADFDGFVHAGSRHLEMLRHVLEAVGVDC